MFFFLGILQLEEEIVVQQPEEEEEQPPPPEQVKNQQIAIINSGFIYNGKTRDATCNCLSRPCEY